VAAYQAHGGTEQVRDGATLCQYARAGDPVARRLVQRAAQGLADVFLRLAIAFDPGDMVMGGGFAGSFDLFEREIREALDGIPEPPAVRPSLISGQAVLIGGLLAADPLLSKWLADRVSAL
jgi:glucokinase